VHTNRTKRLMKRKLKQKTRWAVHSPWRQSGGLGKDLWKKWVLSLEWKRIEVIDGDSGNDGREQAWVKWEEWKECDYDEADEMKQEVDSKDRVIHIEMSDFNRFCSGFHPRKANDAYSPSPPPPPISMLLPYPPHPSSPLTYPSPPLP